MLKQCVNYIEFTTKIVNIAQLIFIPFITNNQKSTMASQQGSASMQNIFQWW